MHHVAVSIQIVFCEDALPRSVFSGASVQDVSIVNSFAVRQCFAGCFTSAATSNFVTLMTGWVLDLRLRTVTEVVRAAGAVGRKHRRHLPRHARYIEARFLAPKTS